MRVDHEWLIPDSEPECTLQIGGATWDETETSIRAYYKNSSGGFSTGSPEVPIELIPAMLEFAQGKGFLRDE